MAYSEPLQAGGRCSMWGLAQVYRWGFLGALTHMAEILPLVALLVGLVTLPSIPGSILIAVSEPLTCAPRPPTHH